MSDEEVAVLNRKMDRVLGILENDGGTGRPGLVAEVAEIRNIVIGHIANYTKDKAEKNGADRVWKVVWGSVGAGVLWVITEIGAVIWSLFTHV